MSACALRTTAAAWLARGEAAMVVRVIETQGSVPRGTDARMLVPLATHRTSAAAAEPPQVEGTIGGGHLEWKAIDHARRLLAREPLPTRLRLPLGPSLGQCCGGVVTLGFEPLSSETLRAWPVPAARFHLQLHGAGHVGRAIVRALEPLDVSIDWIDEREAEFPAAPSGALVRRIATDAVEAEVAQAPTGAFHLVLTHSHDLDLRITEAILRRGDFGFLGLIGSATKKARFLHRFEQRGVPPHTLARLTCPIGLPGITGKEPAVIAVAVVGQLLREAERASDV
jgi:xanthine dehydrogenase accessory factor